MRNKFTELISQGVAAFEYKPTAPEIPSQCRLCRIYNGCWGMITDTHMVEVDGRLIITGTMLEDPRKWEMLMYSSVWGGVQFKSTGYTSLANLFYAERVYWSSITYNNQPAIEIKPIPREEENTSSAVPASYTTSESKFPQPIARLMSTQALRECFRGSKGLKDVVEKLNESEEVPGSDWYYDAKGIGGFVNGIHIMLETSFDAGTKIVNKALSDALQSEDLGEVYLRQFANCFMVDSDDAQWRAVLRKSKFNRIRAKSIKDLSTEEWVYNIKNIINSIS